MVWEPLGFLWSLRSDDLHMNTKTLFFTLTLSQVYSGVFQRLHNILYCSRLNVEADLRIQLSSLKLDIRDLQKCDTVALFSLNYFGLGNIIIFIKMLLMLMYNGFLILFFT